MGGGFLAVFGLIIGIPFVKGIGASATPPNPSAPRPVPVQAGLPVFPGAEGFGTRTPAGRGGKVLFVTNLDDSGPGSLREAVQQPFPRIIIFRVGGTIELKNHIFISHPFITIAGQRAPGDGICLKNAGLGIITHDVLIQHLRVRPGNEGKIEPDTNDAIQIMGTHGRVTAGASNVVIDHCSFSWGEDETVSTWYGAHDITISNCIISEALDRSRHRKGRHSAGLLIGDGSYHVSIHRNLLAHNGFRNPLISQGGTHDVVNNVIYNWGNIPAEVVDGESNSFLNFIGNNFIPGPSSEFTAYDIVFNPGYGSGTPKIYVSGNVGPRLPSPDADNWQIVAYGWENRVAPEQFRSMTPMEVHPVTITSAKEAYEHVLANAGATLPKRDAVDARVVNDVRNKSGRLINSPSEVGGYPALKSGTPPADSDNDGIPDEWETKHGLNPKDPSDANLDRNGDGYTNIEEYLHSLLK